MEQMMHLAAQYLATAAISFLEKKDDDSHTNLGFNPQDGALVTHPLSEVGDKLSLSYKNFTLIWSSLKENTSFDLDGSTHIEILEWLTKVSQKFIGKEYKYELHYDLPYNISDGYQFKLVDSDRLKQLLHLRTKAQLVLKRVLRDNHLTSDVRIWPHHFDTGGFSLLNENSRIAIGLGLAIPDSVCDQHYFYIGGYEGHTPIKVSDFDKLSHGQWSNEGFVGAVLPADTMDEKGVVGFFAEAIDLYKRF